MNRMFYWVGASVVALGLAACSHAPVSSGTYPSTGQAYTIQPWPARDKGMVNYTTGQVLMSLRWADADEGMADWKNGIASDHPAAETATVGTAHGTLSAVRVNLVGQQLDQAGPTLVLDSVSVTSATGNVHYVCIDPKASPAALRVGASDDLTCMRR